MEKLVIAIGSDHGGFEYKNLISDHLKQKGIDVIDVGTYSKDSCDYPEIARKVTGHPIPAEVAERRAGDPAVLIASSS